MERQTQDVTRIDEAKELWYCPVCNTSVPFSAFVCQCGYDARPFLMRMSRGTGTSAPAPKKRKRKYKVSLRFIVRLIVYGGWSICLLAILGTLGTMAMVAPAFLFGLFTLGVLALSSRDRKKKTKLNAAAELAGVAQNLAELAETLTPGKNQRSKR